MLQYWQNRKWLYKGLERNEEPLDISHAER